MSEPFIGRSVFYKIAKKEDDYTQLLCNLMQRPGAKDFRLAVLSRVLRDRVLASHIEPEQISTQWVVPGTGRPDLVIDAPTVRAVIEVKLNRQRHCTENQLPSDVEALDGYYGYLKGASAAQKLLSFLVPREWKYLQDTRKRLTDLSQRDSSIKTDIVFWEEVFGLSKELSSDPLHLEFWQLLRRDFGPLQFTKEEIKVLINQSGLPIRVINRAAFLVDEVAKKCKGEYLFIGPEHDKSGEGYGIEFYRKKSGKGWQKTFFFWFGIWSPYWEQSGRALCFGIKDSMNPEKKAFLESNPGDTERFVNPEDPSDVWTLAWISEADITESASGEDSVARIWTRMQPILERVSSAI